MDNNNIATLIDILHRHEERVKAIAKMIHCTEAERNVLLNEAAVAQMAYLQLEGVEEPATLAPDWACERSADAFG